MSELDVRARYNLLVGTIIPRPIAWVTTRSPEGSDNLAPFSFFNGVSSDPPCLSISIGRKADGTKKDTLRNIEATKQFVVNTVNQKHLDAVVTTGAEFPYGESEAAHCGLTLLQSLWVMPPRLQDAPVSFECEVYTSIDIGTGAVGSSTLIVGKILVTHVAEDALDSNVRPCSEVLAPLARLGGISYSALGPTFERKIPSVLTAKRS